MGPLCCPKVLARFPVGEKPEPFVLQNILRNESRSAQRPKLEARTPRTDGHTILCPYPGESIIRSSCQESPIALRVGGREHRAVTQPTAEAEVSCPHTGAEGADSQGPTFQSSEVTSLLLGTSCPPSRIQWRSTSWVELELLFSFRFQIRAVESPELNRIAVRPGVSRLSQHQHVSDRSNQVVCLQE